MWDMSLLSFIGSVGLSFVLKLVNGIPSIYLVLILQAAQSLEQPLIRYF